MDGEDSNGDMWYEWSPIDQLIIDVRYDKT